MKAPLPQCLALALASLALAAGSPASAQEAPAQAAPVPAAAPAAAPVLPGNKVQCVYDYMAVEDREMALLLFAREIANGGRFRKGSPNVQAVDRLIEEAHEKCLARFNWSVARSDAATGYALAAVLVEALFNWPGLATMLVKAVGDMGPYALLGGLFLLGRRRR